MGTSATRTSTPSSGLLRRLRAATPVLVSGGLLLLLPVVLQAPVLGLGLALATALLIGLLVLGLERGGACLVVAGTALAPLDALRPIPFLSFASASDLVLALGLLVLAPVLLVRRLPVHTLFLVGAAGLFVVGVVSSTLAAEPLASLNNVLRLVVGAMILPLAYATWRPGKQVAVLLASAFVAGNAFNAVYARVEGTVSDEGRYPGLSTHVNVLGFCAMLAVALAPFLLAAVPRRFRWAVVVVTALSAYGVWISGSRAALLVAVAVVVLYPVLARSIPVAVWLFGLSIPPLWIVARTISEGVTGTNPIGRLFGGGSATLSDVARRELTDEAIRTFEADPLVGVGFAQALEAHNIYLQVAAAAGILGVAFFLVLLFSVLRQPFLLPGAARLLALPALSYGMVGVMTTLIWDRYIWCVLALPFLMTVPAADDAEAAPVGATTTEEST